MKRRLALLTAVGLIAVLAVFTVSACSPVPGANGAAGVFDTGVDPDGWALVPAGEFLSGQFDKETDIEYDYEIMVTEVTNLQYAEYLNQALAAGKVKVTTGNPGSTGGNVEGYVNATGGFYGDRVEGYYDGDAFHGYKHEFKVEPGWYIQMPLSDPGTRIVFDGTRFGVKPGYENHPVTMVSWFGAKAYADFHGWRLPTELEWEKAARGTDGRPYPWGDSIGAGNANFYKSGDPFETPGVVGDTTPVGFYNGRTYDGFQTVDSRSPYGLYDVGGNVREWTADIYEGTHLRYIRGGSKADYGFELRIWTRYSATPVYASPNLGFRCVRGGESPASAGGH